MITEKRITQLSDIAYFFCFPGVPGQTLTDHVCEDPADIFSLRAIVARPCVIPGHGHDPTFVPVLKPPEKSRGIIDILSWIEHGPQAAERVAVIMMVDLHAANIDQTSTFVPRRSHNSLRVPPALGKVCVTLDVECVWM